VRVRPAALKNEEAGKAGDEQHADSGAGEALARHYVMMLHRHHFYAYGMTMSTCSRRSASSTPLDS